MMLSFRRVMLRHNALSGAAKAVVRSPLQPSHEADFLRISNPQFQRRSQRFVESYENDNEGPLPKKRPKPYISGQPKRKIDEASTNTDISKSSTAHQIGELHSTLKRVTTRIEDVDSKLDTIIRLLSVPPSQTETPQYEDQPQPPTVERHDAHI